jgi:hypothetical protein
MALALPAALQAQADDMEMFHTTTDHGVSRRVGSKPVSHGPQVLVHGEAGTIEFSRRDIVEPVVLPRVASRRNK